MSDSLPVVPNFIPAMKITLGASGKESTKRALQQVALDRLDAVRLQPAAGFRAGEATDAPHAASHAGRVAGPAGHAGQGGAHLARRPQDENIPVDLPQRADGRRARPAQEFLQLFDVVDHFGRDGSGDVGHNGLHVLMKR